MSAGAIDQLPTETIHHILKLADPTLLGTACKVSQGWNTLCSIVLEDHIKRLEFEIKPFGGDEEPLIAHFVGFEDVNGTEVGIWEPTDVARASLMRCTMLTVHLRGPEGRIASEISHLKISGDNGAACSETDFDMVVTTTYETPNNNGEAGTYTAGIGRGLKRFPDLQVRATESYFRRILGMVDADKVSPLAVMPATRPERLQTLQDLASREKWDEISLNQHRTLLLMYFHRGQKLEPITCLIRMRERQRAKAKDKLTKKDAFLAECNTHIDGPLEGRRSCNRNLLGVRDSSLEPMPKRRDSSNNSMLSAKHSETVAYLAA
eukprot:Clim_evm50s153 gene=Clim_evmTU50s153